MTSAELERQTAKILRELIRELGNGVEADRVLSAGRGHYERLSRDATVTDFIPLLVYRFTKEELVSSARGQLHDAA